MESLRNDLLNSDNQNSLKLYVTTWMGFTNVEGKKSSIIIMFPFM